MDNKEKYIDHLHNGAKPGTHQFARELRQTETAAEKKLWSLLRNRQLQGRKFRRQHALADYILDFYCHECKLAVEVDGNVHAGKINQEYDSARTAFLNGCGITVLRFWNSEVMNEQEKVLEKIAKHLGG
jgi:very-short-patch-repair endonuclease